MSKSSSVGSGNGRDPFASYIKSLRTTYLSEKTEHTDRDAIKVLLQGLAPSGITVVPEPRQIARSAPDFKIRQNGQIVGYLEAKPLGTGLAELKRIANGEQIGRYKALSKNIVLTDYLNWIWIKGNSEQSRTLCDIDELETYKTTPEQGDVKELGLLLRGFLSSPPQRIGRSSDLADELAVRTRFLRDFLSVELTRQQHASQGERLYGLFLAFKKQVSESISVAEFADAFAQTLSYGLFLSKLNANGHSLHLGNAKQFIPKSFRLIQELVGFIDELEDRSYKDIEWVVDEILSITNGIDTSSIKEDLSFRNRKAPSKRIQARDEEEWRLFSRDPFVYFYEDFLAKYDSDLRRSRGVYYTPPPVVKFIVRSVDDLLKSELGLKSGLSDSRVTVLDFACGTGTFVVEVIQRIVENLGSSPAKLKIAIEQHALKNIFAFEYLIAPYTVAHLKLAQYLEERQINIADNRFNIFLTNTLEPINAEPNLLVPALSEETTRAAAVKKRPVLVIVGNPPYSYQSKNNGTWAKNSIEVYKKCDGVSISEKNSRGLQDDYIKFIRFAQWKMEHVEEGIVGVVTNNSFLDSPTHRGMRRSLMQTFNHIYILDLHGSVRRGDQAPEGQVDQNVFDIEQGVSISIFVKKKNSKESRIFRSDMWGDRISKYRTLGGSNNDSISWREIQPVAPFYLFAYQDQQGWDTYKAGWSIPDIMPLNSSGIVTGRDGLAIHRTPEGIASVIANMKSRPESDLRARYQLGKDSTEWVLRSAIDDIRSEKGEVTRVLYRPFDYRFTYFSGKSRGFLNRPRFDVMKNLANNNVALITSRLTKGEDFAHVHISDTIVEKICLSPKTSNNGFAFPLYVGADLFERTENFSPEFRKWIDKRYAREFSPEQIFGYIYAVLHCERYRVLYSEFLRMDFPKILFPKSASGFISLSELGWELAQWHLMNTRPEAATGNYLGDGEHLVDQVEYAGADNSIYISASQRFCNVSADVWNYRVGGYKVLMKYLKDRIDSKLTLSEIEHLEGLIGVLTATVGQMQKINDAYDSAFGIN